MHVFFLHCRSFPYISLRVLWGFLVLCLPFSPPLTPPVCISFPFMSLSVPCRFPFISLCCPVMSTSCPLHVLAYPFIFSPHFPALPRIFPSLPGFFPEKNKHVFSYVFAKMMSNTQIFARFSAKGVRKARTSKEPGGDSSWDPCFATPAPRRLFLVERHQITARYVGDPSDVGRGGKGGLSSILS